MRDKQGRFRPGYSGNPAGRPRVSIVDELKRKLQEVPEGERENFARLLADHFVEWLFTEAMAGRMHGWAFRDLIDRVDGKPHEFIRYENDREEELLRHLVELDEEIVAEQGRDRQNLSSGNEED